VVKKKVKKKDGQRFQDQARAQTRREKEHTPTEERALRTIGPRRARAMQQHGPDRPHGGGGPGERGEQAAAPAAALGEGRHGGGCGVL
jgi:hypothetical protein